MNDVEISNGDLIDGRYEVFERKAGGMGEVFFCCDITKDRKVVAIKTFMGTWNQQARRQFLSEIDASLRAPKATHNYYLGINRVFLVHNKPFIEMDYCPGGSLADLISKAPLEYERFVVMSIEFAIAMWTLHEEYGLLHRDLKPGNLLFDEQGRIKVADLGLAKALSLAQSADEYSSSIKHLYGQNTQVGLFRGTLFYASPEQRVDSSNVGATTDIWSYGVVLFEALTGTHPFIRGDMGSTCKAIQSGDVPWGMLKDCKQDIRDILSGCLQVDPRDRLQSFRYVLKGFDKIVRYSSSPTVGPPDTRIVLDDNQLEQFWLELYPERKKGFGVAFNIGYLNRYKEAMSYYEVGLNQSALDSIKSAIGLVDDEDSLLNRFIRDELYENPQFEDCGGKHYLIPQKELVEEMLDLQLRIYLNLTEEGDGLIKDEYLKFVYLIQDKITSLNAIVSCAQGFIKCGLYERARRMLNSLSSESKQDARYWGTYVNALLHEGNSEAIREVWMTSIFPSIGHSLKWGDLWVCARVCSMLGLIEETLFYYSKLYDLEPNDQSITYNLSIALINSGELGQAKVHLGELEKMDRNSQFVRHLKEIISELEIEK